LVNITIPEFVEPVELVELVRPIKNYTLMPPSTYFYSGVHNEFCNLKVAEVAALLDSSVNRLCNFAF
jgi:hypothetical protein